MVHACHSQGLTASSVVFPVTMGVARPALPSIAVQLGHYICAKNPKRELSGGLPIGFLVCPSIMYKTQGSAILFAEIHKQATATKKQNKQKTPTKHRGERSGFIHLFVYSTDTAAVQWGVKYGNGGRRQRDGLMFKSIVL